jgi:hypothetical protein
VAEDWDTMTVKELIERLLQQPQSAKVRLSIANPKDTAYTNEIIEISREKTTGMVSIEGWVSFDNSEEAHAPWASEFDPKDEEPKEEENQQSAT